MRILYTASIEYGPQISTGDSVHVHNVVRLLRERGHEVLVFACPREGSPSDGQVEPDIDYVGKPPKGFVSLLRFNIAYWSRLRRRMKPRADIIYSRFGIWQFSPSLFARKRRIPLILEVNGVPDLDRKLGWLHGKILKSIFRSADRIIVVADRMGEHFAQIYGIPPERFITIKNGVDCDLYRPLGDRQREYVPQGRPVIGYAGSLIPFWDLDLFWQGARRILERFPNALFVAAGEGPMDARLREQFSRLGLSSHLLLTGPLPYADAGRLMAECDVLAAFFKPLPRNDMMSPVKVYHYLAVGVPTIASDIHVMKQFKGSGLITFKPGDPMAFAEAVIRCLSLSPEEKRRLGEQGRDFIKQHFTWRHTVCRIEAVLSELLQAKQ